MQSWSVRCATPDGTENQRINRIPDLGKQIFMKKTEGIGHTSLNIDEFWKEIIRKIENSLKSILFYDKIYSTELRRKKHERKTRKVLAENREISAMGIALHLLRMANLYGFRTQKSVSCSH